MKLIYFFIFLSSQLLAAENSLEIIGHTGQVFIRHGFGNEWQVAANGIQLKENDAIKSQINSSARIQTENGDVFLLPANSLVEGRELKSYSRTELMLILTSFEISEIAPVKKSAPPVPSGAFVIHGEQKAKEVPIDSAGIREYLEFEQNGLQALVGHRYWAGVVLKVLKLKSFVNFVDEEFLDYMLLEAYTQLKLVKRYEKLKADFVKKYPNSGYNKIKDIK
ncbi:hypothetical protein JW964_09500 [candidate division KSB1 bacterium]|nr:hypothetical protein [candidate division KSB1 bacterium]